MTASAGLLYLALFALAAHKQRHRPALLGPWERKAFVPHLDLAGWLLMLVSLLSLYPADDIGMAFVGWIGLVAAVACLVTLGMTYGPSLVQSGVAVALAMIIFGLLG